jgi:hypothetical protein
MRCTNYWTSQVRKIFNNKGSVRQYGKQTMTKPRVLSMPCHVTCSDSVVIQKTPDSGTCWVQVLQPLLLKWLHICCIWLQQPYDQILSPLFCSSNCCNLCCRKLGQMRDVTVPCMLSRYPLPSIHHCWSGIRLSQQLQNSSKNCLMKTPDIPTVCLMAEHKWICTKERRKLPISKCGKKKTTFILLYITV